MVIRLLVQVTVNDADTTYVGVLALLDHDTIADDQVVLIGIDHQGRTCRQPDRVLIMHKQRILSTVLPGVLVGARGETRTRTSFRTTDFKSVASTSSATRARAERIGG